MNEIRKLRAAHGWTQRKLADILGVTVTTVSRWETGRSPVDPLKMAGIKATLLVVEKGERRKAP